MSLRKSELDELNQRLLAALRTAQAENETLRVENQRLSEALRLQIKQSEKQHERFQKLVLYVQTLRTWVQENR